MARAVSCVAKMSDIGQDYAALCHSGLRKLVPFEGLVRRYCRGGEEEYAERSLLTGFARPRAERLRPVLA